MEKKEEQKLDEAVEKIDGLDFSAGLESFLSSMDDSAEAENSGNSINDNNSDEASAEQDIPAVTETQEQSKTEEKTEEELPKTEENIVTEETEEKKQDADSDAKEENPVTDLMTDASTSESTGNLPSQTELEQAAKEEASAQVDAAIEKMVSDTVGSIDLVSQKQKEETPEAKAPEASTETSAKPKKRKMKTSVKLMLVLLIAMVAGVGAYYGYQVNYFSTHFFPNTLINGIDASEAVVDEVESEIKKSTEVFSMDIRFRGKKKEHFTGEDIDYTYTATGEVSELMKNQNIYFWFLEMNREHSYEVTTPMEYDEKKLDEVLESMKEMDKSRMQAPKDAYVDWRGNKFIVVKEVRGNKLDTDLVKEAIHEAVASGTTEIVLEDLDGAYENPKLTMDDEKLKKHRDELNDYIDASITIETPGKDYTLDSKTLHEWLVPDKDGLLTKKDDVWKEKLAGWIRGVAEEVDNVGGYQSFPATGIGIVKVRQSGYGWSIDEAGEVEKLAEEIEKHEHVTRDPIWATEPFSNSNYGFGYTYAEVDVSRQHVWVYVDGECVLSTDCVTGAMIPSRYTPAGIFQLYWKRSPSILRGEMRADGTREYETRVEYWMPFNGGIGFHDATWQPYFGGSRYLEGGGSHGCVNLPMWAAKELYSIVDSGFPVIVYYSNGCPI